MLVLPFYLYTACSTRDCSLVVDRGRRGTLVEVALGVDGTVVAVVRVGEALVGLARGRAEGHLHADAVRGVAQISRLRSVAVRRDRREALVLLVHA